MKHKISTHSFTDTIESNNINIFSEIITLAAVKQAYLYFLTQLTISDNQSDQNLFRELSEFSPKKVQKFIIKLTTCLLPESYEVTAKKELYRDNYSFVARIYADQIWRLNTDPIAKIIISYKGPLFRKIPESKYLSQKHINKLNSKGINAYPYAYSFSPTIIGIYCLISAGNKIDLEGVSQVNNFKELFANAFDSKNIKFKKLGSKKTKEFEANTPPDNYFKIRKQVFCELMQHAALSVMCGKNHSEVTSIQTLKKNVMFEGADGYLYINNLSRAELEYLKDNRKYLPLDEYGRRYTILNSIKKSIRTAMFKGRFEYDIDSSAVMTLLNIRFSGFRKESEENFIKQIRETYPSIFKLISEKKATRYLVAEAFGCTYGQAKQLTNTVVFDPANRIKYKFKRKRETQVKFTIQLIRELRHLSRVVQYIVFDSTEDEVNLNYKYNGLTIKEIRTIVSEDIRISKFNNPKKFGRGKKYHGKKLFRLYAIMENGVRKAMMEYAEKIGSHCNQLHDCIFIDQKIQVRHLTNYIQYRTGYTYLFGETIL